jgi:hypothetical protein
MIKHIQAKHPYKISTNEAAAVELVTTLINVMYLILKELNHEITVALRCGLWIQLCCELGYYKEHDQYRPIHK